MRLGPPPEEPEVPGQFWKDFIRDTAPVFRTPTIEQLGSFLAPTWQALIDGSIYVNPRPPRSSRTSTPMPSWRTTSWPSPRSRTAGMPWARIMSCNPLEMPDPDIPPVFSGYAGRRPGRRGGSSRPNATGTHREMWNGFDAFMRASAAPRPPDLGFMLESPFLNLSLYPAETDYRAPRPLAPPGTASTPASARPTTRSSGRRVRTRPNGRRSVDLPVLGSLGSADVELMERLVALLGGYALPGDRQQGTAGRPFDLPANMWGQEFVPQTSDPPARRRR